MKNLKIAALMILASAMLATMGANGQTLQDVCGAFDSNDVDYDVTDYDALRDADNFCKLAYNDGHKARRQLDKMIAGNRGRGNPNRWYPDARYIYGVSAGEYTQLMRPWMRDDPNAEYRALWNIWDAEWDEYTTVYPEIVIYRLDLEGGLLGKLYIHTQRDYEIAGHFPSVELKLRYRVRKYGDLHQLEGCREEVVSGEDLVSELERMIDCYKDVVLDDAADTHNHAI